MTQNKRILEWLQVFGTITPKEAYGLLGCMRLSARIHDLRKAGHNITTVFRTYRRKDGETVTYAEYQLTPENTEGKL